MNSRNPESFGFGQLPYSRARGLSIQGGFISGARADAFVNIQGTWKNTVAVTGVKINCSFASAVAGSRMLDVQANGVTQFQVNSGGNITVAGNVTTAGGGAGAFTISSKSKIQSSADGLFELFNNAATGFTRLNFGGTTSSFPAIGASGTSLEILGADGAGPSALWVYNTKTSSTNFERVDIQWAANVAQLWTEKGGGGGTGRDFVHGADATELLRFSAGSKLSFFAATPVVKQTSGANLTNNVVASGTTDQIDDFTSLTIYATDAPAIHNDIYQLARKLKQINDGLRAYGIFT